ncbi:UNKNOWN [Stylonychia lemnae]|uniref:Uncharacterized protein n=1 Tax=Stylonychia lemnae TaxID=5949 RepID=A0A078A824_STYLE|nr:UNKNOWN [Stylonychia lemnae]|eukprot:CDW78021.1 UNKNOWN [Stylonychia lemnae]
MQNLKLITPLFCFSVCFIFSIALSHASSASAVVDRKCFTQKQFPIKFAGLPQKNEIVDITNIQESDGDLVFGGSITISGIKSPLLGYYDQDIYYSRLKWMFSILTRISDLEFKRIVAIYIKNGKSYFTIKSDTSAYLAVIKFDNYAMEVVSAVAIPDCKQWQSFNHLLTVDENGFAYIIVYFADSELPSILKLTMGQDGTSWQTKLNYPTVLSSLIPIATQSSILVSGIIQNPGLENAIFCFKLTDNIGHVTDLLIYQNPSLPEIFLTTKVSVVYYNEVQNTILICYEKYEMPYFSGFIYTNIGISQTQRAHFSTDEYLNYLEVIYHNTRYKLLVKIISQDQATEKYIFFSFYEDSLLAANSEFTRYDIQEIKVHPGFAISNLYAKRMSDRNYYTVVIKSTYSFSVIYSDYDDQQCGAFITLEDSTDFITATIEIFISNCRYLTHLLDRRDLLQDVVEFEETIDQCGARGTIQRIYLILTTTLANISFYQKILQISNKCHYAQTHTSF